MQLINLLQIEYKKFSSNVVIRFLLIIYTLMMPFIIFIGKKLDVDGINKFIDPTVFYEFPSIWDYQGYIGQWMVFIFLGFVGVIIVSSEIRNKTLRQSIINGMTRQEYFLSKILSITTICLYATLIYWVSSFFIGLYHTPEFSLAILWDNKWAGFRFFLMSFGYLSFAMVLTFWLKRSGLAIFLYLAYIIFEPLIRWLVFFKFEINNQSVLYYPGNVIEDLMPFPLFKFADAIPFKEIDFPFLLDYKVAALMTILYTSIFIFISYRAFLKSDI